MELTGIDAIEDALALLSATLEARGVAPVELVVIGGAAMNVLGIAVRPTKDVDVLGLADSSCGHDEVMLIKHKPLPALILEAAAAVAAALGLDPGWLNAGPADLLDWGLPEGFGSRLTPRVYGTHLVVHFPSREDLVCFKVYAAADVGVGRHTEDLAALRPSSEELRRGAQWAHSQDPSEGFRTMLLNLLQYMGCDDAEEAFSNDD
ncbi:MAG: hypothetical protein FD171_1086 [Actinobacteria bacterium]|nr:MAG: hypothetical protein FD171_1086 [Actinomycetota bacterium]